MPTDLKGNQISTGDMIVSAQAAEMLKTCKTVGNFTSPKEGPVRDDLKKSVQEVIVKMDPNATAEEAKDKGWVSDLIASVKESKVKDKKTSEDKGDFSTYLSRIAEAADKMLKNDCSIWIGICDISKIAQKKIAEAIKMSDCCGAVSASSGKAANKAASKAGATKGVLKDTVAASAAAGTAAAAAAGTAAAAAAGTAAAGGGKGPPPLPPSSKGSLPLPPSGPTPSGPSGPSGMTKAFNAAGAAAKFLGHTMRIVHTQMVNTLNLGFSANVLQGAVQDANNFRENMRQILHQQQGFTAANRDAEKSFHDLTSSVMASGISRADYQKLWLKNLQRGYVFQEKGDKAQLMAANRMKSVTTTAAHTAKSLGMDVSATSDLFMDWHQHLALSTNDLAEMGRHMKSIARTTGVTGAELQKAMGTAAKMTKSLQDAGLASAAALKMATKIAAISQKHGVGEDFAAIQKALSGSKGFFEASNEMKSMLTRAASMTGGKVKPEQVISGAVSGSPTLQRELFKGMELDTRRFLKQSGFGAKADSMDLTNINEEIQKLQKTAAESTNPSERNKANNSLIALGKLAQQMGTDLGGLQGRMRTIQENQMTSGERLTKMTNELNKAMSEGKGGLDATKQLQKQVAEMETSAMLDALNKTNNTMKDAGVNSMSDLGDDAKKALQNRIAEELGGSRAQKFMEDAGQSIKDLTASMSKRAEESKLDLTTLAKERGFSSVKALEEALQSGEKDKRDVALQALGEIDQMISRKERTGQDPVTDIRDTLLDLNTRLRGVIESALFRLSDSVAQMVYWIGQAVSLLGSVVGFLASIWGAVSMFKMGSSVVSAVTGAVGTAGVAGGGTVAGVGGAVAGGGASSVVAGGGAVAGTGLSSLAAILGPLAAGLMGIYGAVKGGREAEEARRNTKEGALLGALTGGAKTGSRFSERLGVEKGTKQDKALGVMGGAAWGAAMGALLAPLTGGISIAVGALIGAAMEVVKIFTEGTNILQRYFIRPFEGLFSGLWTIVKGLWDIVAGLVTLDLSRIGDGIKKIFQGIYHAISEIVKWAFDAVINLIGNLPTIIKNVIVKGIEFLLTGISTLLSSLADNEYIGAIFKPIYALWESLRTIFDPILDLFSNLLDLRQAFFTPFKDALMSLFGPLLEAGDGTSMFGAAMKALGVVVKVIAAVIGAMITTVLWPFTKIFQAIGAVVGWVVGVIKPVIKFLQPIFSAIADIIVGFAKIVYYLFAVVILGLYRTVLEPIITGVGKIFGYLAQKWQDFVTWMEPVTSVISKVGNDLLWFLQTVWSPFGTAIGFVGEMIMGTIQLTKDMVDGVVGWFKWLYDKLVGHSIIPDLVFGIIKFFAMLPFTILKGLATLGIKIVSSITGMLVDLAKSVFGVFDTLLGGIPGKIIGVLTEALGGVAKGFSETNADANTRIAEDGYSAAHGVGRVGGGIWDMITGGGQGRIEGFKKAIGGFWETNMAAVTGLMSMATSAWDTAKGLWDSTWDSVTGFLGGIGNWFNEATGGLGTYLSEVWDGFGDWLGQGATAVSEMFGEAVDGVTGFFEGIFTSPGETLSKAMDGANAVMSSIGEGIKSGISGAASAISNSSFNPLNWFQQGTREINRTGIAVLHEGETVIPKHIWEQITAVGNGPFGSGSDVIGSISGDTGGFDFGDRLISAIEDLTNVIIEAGFANLGAFASGETVDAMMYAVDNTIKYALATKDDDAEKDDKSLAERVNRFMPDRGKDSFHQVNNIMSSMFSPTGLSNIFSKAFSPSSIIGDVFSNKSTDKNESRSVSDFTSAVTNKNESRSASDFTSAVTNTSSVLGNGMSSIFNLIGSAISWAKDKTVEVTSAEKDLKTIKVESNYTETGAFDPKETQDAIIGANSVAINQWSAGYEMMTNAFNESLGSKMNFMNNDSLDSAVDQMHVASLIIDNNALSDVTKSIDNSLTKAMDTTSSSFIDTIVTDMGLFSPTQIGDAIDQVTSQYLQEQTQYYQATQNQSMAAAAFDAMNARNAAAAKGDATQLAAGLFSREDNISQATDESVSSVTRSMLEKSDISGILAQTVKERQEQQRTTRTFADLSKALSYETSASDADVSVTSNRMESASFRGEVATNAQDYSDEIAGTVSTLLTNRDSVESYLEREKVGATSTNATLLPSMEDIASYLIVSQAAKLDEMISLLGDIKSNTAMSGSYMSEVIGPISEGLPPMTRPGVKSLSQDYARGRWDLTFVDSSPSSVTTEGRGGSD